MFSDAQFYFINNLQQETIRLLQINQQEMMKAAAEMKPDKFDNFAACIASVLREKDSRVAQAMMQQVLNYILTETEVECVTVTDLTTT